MTNFDKPYDPKEVEEKIYREWEEAGYFSPEAHQPRPRNPKSKKSFTIVIPPPNITGSLHMGHALNATIQDILIRKKRMEGYRTLWLPGIDHAGIATQNVVEKELRKQGINRRELGREKFLEKVWEWKEKYGHIILDQLKKLGASMDWSRTRFTMDEDYQEAVKQAFIHYYNRGWIYRGERTVNWCSRCGTSLSDLEIEYKEEDAQMYYIKYGPLTIATVRPETKLGDTAVAVNPKDARYKKYIGKVIEIDTVLGRALMKVIADPSVDMKFGTGVMKVTPAHDLHDFELGERYGLEKKQVIGTDGKMTALAGKYAGMKVEETRKQIVEDMKTKGILIKTEPYKHNVAVCYRCGMVLEPLLSKQWFVRMASPPQNQKSPPEADPPLAEKIKNQNLGKSLRDLAIEAVKSGRVKFHPKRWEKIYFDWLTNVKDWCISRQIWWGHQLPVWYCGGTEKAEQPKMGFHEEVVPQVFDGKTKTYRLRDHGLKVGQKVLFENSQTKTLFGYGIIKEIKETTVQEIDYGDKTHYKTYKNLKELLRAFKLRNPDKIVTPKSKAYLYAYEFYPFTEEDAREGCGQIIVSREKPKQCPACKGIKFIQDQDVLDTWFSSALWPFATLGWPIACAQNQKSKIKNQNYCVPRSGTDLEQFYPTQVLSTDRGIINLWVARMVFSGLEFMGQVPFKDVIIHPTILTREGERMSKSKGTGVDPLDLIQKYGADATRFGIIWQTMGTQDVRWSEEHVVAGKKFTNKIWNATRFVLLQLPTSNLQPRQKPQPKTLEDKKILTSLKRTQKEVNRLIDAYEFGPALHILYEFFWHEFCDIYLERSKSQIAHSMNSGQANRESEESTQQVLLYILTGSLKLLHPFMPFITEAIYQELPHGGTESKSIMI